MKIPLLHSLQSSFFQPIVILLLGSCPVAALAQPDGKPGKLHPTHKDVHYGSHERQVFDLYLADATNPTPLIVYIHGGGFVAGDKQSIRQEMLRAALRDGISVAAVNYRFVNGEDLIFPTPQRDCARALQFIRENAKTWNLNTEKVACFGGSAGAGISMWIGFHEDLANPNSADPVSRQSTRIVALGTFGGQGTYDPIKIKELVGGRAWEHSSITKVYGLNSAKDALTPDAELQSLYDEASAITHLTSDDPPLFMVYSEPDIVPPADSRPGQFIHHPNFGKQLKKEMDRLAIENHYVHTDQARGRNVTIEMYEFLRDQLVSRREGELIFSDDFERNESSEEIEQVGNGWATNSKSRANGNKQVDLVDGTMHVYFHESADHAVSVRHDAEFKDGMVRLRFMLPKPKDSLGLNFADLEYKKVHAGHLCAVRIGLNEVRLQDLKTGNMDLETRQLRLAKKVPVELQKKLDTKTKRIGHKLKPGVWYQLETRIIGDTLSLDIDGREVGRFSSEGIAHPTKRTLRLAVPGEAYLDDLEIIRFE